MAVYTGDSDDNSITGSADGDSIDISQGGEDTVNALDGNDSIFLGAALDAGDRIDGGAGYENLFLSGDYSAGLVLSDQTITGVENIFLGGDFDYDLTLADGTASNLESSFVAIGADLMAAGRHFHVDGSAIQSDHGLYLSFTNAHGEVIGSQGDDLVVASTGVGYVDFRGGAGRDTASFLRTITTNDRLVGGGDAGDKVQLYNGQTVDFTPRMMKGFDTFALLQGSYDLTMADGNLAGGHTLFVDASGLLSGQTMTLDATAERSGSYLVSAGEDADSIYGGAGADTIYGNAGNDVISGGKGADRLGGGDGADSFVYSALNQSGHHKLFDFITDLDASDHIDLSAIDANTTKAGNQAFHVVDQFHGKAGELVLSYDAGENLTTLAVDVNGDGRADLALHMAGDQSGFAGLVL